MPRPQDLADSQIHINSQPFPHPFPSSPDHISNSRSTPTPQLQRYTSSTIQLFLVPTKLPVLQQLTYSIEPSDDTKRVHDFDICDRALLLFWSAQLAVEPIKLSLTWVTIKNGNRKACGLWFVSYFHLFLRGLPRMKHWHLKSRLISFLTIPFAVDDSLAFNSETVAMDMKWSIIRLD